MISALPMFGLTADQIADANEYDVAVTDLAVLAQCSRADVEAAIQATPERWQDAIARMRRNVLLGGTLTDQWFLPEPFPAMIAAEWTLTDPPGLAAFAEHPADGPAARQAARAVQQARQVRSRRAARKQAAGSRRAQRSKA